jgi:hypothetical protein
MQLLIDTLPLLCRSKKDVLLFFKGAGVPHRLWSDLDQRVRNDRENINKYEIVRTILTRLNERGEPALRERREVLKRVVEFEDFSTCWPSDQLKAKGLVGEIQRVVNVKDSFTRMKQERERERGKRAAEIEKQAKAAEERQATIDSIKRDLFALFGEKNPQKRGRALEAVLNRLFKVDGILVRVAFTVRGPEGEGVVEQIDGVVEIGGQVYLVEMKWWHEPLGKAELSQHLVTVYHRGQTRGICISQSGFTDPAVAICKEGLTNSVFVLCELEEIVRLLEGRDDHLEFWRAKIHAAMTDKNPLHRPPV